jgi:hypothetical protein
LPFRKILLDSEGKIIRDEKGQPLFTHWQEVIFS